MKLRGAFAYNYPNERDQDDRKLSQPGFSDRTKICAWVFLVQERPTIFIFELFDRRFSRTNRNGPFFRQGGHVLLVTFESGAVLVLLVQAIEDVDGLLGLTFAIYSLMSACDHTGLN